MRLSDVNNAVRQLLANVTLAKPVLAINAGGAATVKTTIAIPYTVNGVHYSKAILAAQSIAPTHNFMGQAQPGGYVQPANTQVYYTLGVNAAGAIAVVQGSYAGQKFATDPTVGLGSASNMGTTWQGMGEIPDVPDGYTAFGVIKVVTGGVTFTPGTTALDAANVTASFFDICLLPAGNL